MSLSRDLSMCEEKEMVQNLGSYIRTSSISRRYVSIMGTYARRYSRTSGIDPRRLSRISGEGVDFKSIVK